MIPNTTSVAPTRGGGGFKLSNSDWCVFKRFISNFTMSFGDYNVRHGGLTPVDSFSAYNKQQNSSKMKYRGSQFSSVSVLNWEVPKLCVKSMYGEDMNELKKNHRWEDAIGGWFWRSSTKVNVAALLTLLTVSI